jgi:hypothetical protein
MMNKDENILNLLKQFVNSCIEEFIYNNNGDYDNHNWSKEEDIKIKCRFCDNNEITYSKIISDWYVGFDGEGPTWQRLRWCKKCGKINDING